MTVRMTQGTAPKKSPVGPDLNIVHVMKMTPELAERLKGKAFGFIRLPLRLAIGSRVFLREFNGALTGRADVCEVVSYTDHGLACVRRSWCWHRDAPEDLSLLSLKLSAEVYPVLIEAEAQAA